MRNGIAAAALAALCLCQACSVPQSGAERYAYIPMASVDVGVAAMLPPALWCGWRYDRDPPKACDALVYTALAAGTAVSAVVLANLESDEEPGAAEWIVVVTPASLLAIASVYRLLDKLAD